MQENVVNKDAESYSYLSEPLICLYCQTKEVKDQFLAQGLCDSDWLISTLLLRVKSVLQNCLGESSLLWSKAKPKESYQVGGFISYALFLIYFMVKVNPVSLAQASCKAMKNVMDFYT